MKPITAERLIRIISMSLLTVVIAVILYKFSTLVVYALIALILTYLLDPYVNHMQAAGIPRVLSIIIAISILISALIWISTSIFPIVASQIVTLTQELNVNNIRNIANTIDNQITIYLPFLPDGILRDSIIGLISQLFAFEGIQNTLSGAVSLFTNVFYALIVIPFSTFFFLKDGFIFRRSLLTYVPNHYFEITLSIIDKIESRLGLYFRSVGVQSIIIGLTAWILLSIIGLKNSLAVAVVVGVANTIPYFGPAIGYILAFLVSILETGDFTLTVPALAVILATQLLDNILIQPYIFSKTTDIHPVLILFVVLIGAELAGILGMLIAIPLATIIKIMIVEISWSFTNFNIFKLRNS